MRRVDGGPLLVRVPNWLGDLILALPVLDAAGRGAAVFLGPEPFRELLAPRFPRAEYVSVSRERRWAPLPAIRAARPRAALLLTESLSSAILVRLAGVPERIGYAAEARGALLTRRVPRAGAPRSLARAAEYRALAEAAGLAVTGTTPTLRALPEEAASAKLILASAGLDARPYAVLAPGAAYGPAKQWGAERFAATALHLARRRGLAPLLVGSSADAAVAADVARRVSAAGVSATDLSGRTTLGALTGLLAGARAVVSNDSGVMHLAAALERPTVAVFGSTSPVWTSVASPWVANLYAAYPCSPCYRRTCPIGYGCLRSIESGDAAGALDRLLG
jgi:lipopolysaccharide heptosyltransferase II